MVTKTVTVGVEPPFHKKLKQIAKRRGWKMLHAANEAVRALEERETPRTAAVQSVQTG